jgi:hypothetical protein
MGSSFSLSRWWARAGVLVLGAALAVVLMLAPAAQAASFGRVVPHGWDQHPGHGLRALPRTGDAATTYSLWDAQPSGALIAAWGSLTTVTATDATGKTAWSVSGQDVWTVSGVLPAAMAAVFNNPDPNVLRSGTLYAYNADGSVRFQKSFTKAFVQPLCDTSKRLVWVEVSAKRVTRVFVRQGSVTHSVALPYRASKASFPNPAACSANGSHLAVGTFMRTPNVWRDQVYWIAVSRSGVPVIVSHRMTDWVSVSLSPEGAWAAVMTGDDQPNLWLRFGRFSGRYLPGEDTSEIEVGSQAIFEMEGYSYSSDTTSWGVDTAEVLGRPTLIPIYKRAWVNDGQSDVWFNTDPDIGWLTSLNATPGSLIVVNLMTWDTAVVPTVYVDAMPVKGGQIATLTDTGTLAYIANPVPNP